MFFPRYGSGEPHPNEKRGKWQAQVNSVKRFIAYFSMEIALQRIPCRAYSGGLGVLAGDTIRAAADLRLPMVAVTLLYRKGYFSQRLAEDGTQTEEPVEWRVEDFLHEESPRSNRSPLEGRRVELRLLAILQRSKGVRGYEVPVYFLDADLPSQCRACGSQSYRQLYTVAIPTTVFVRKLFWASVVFACFEP